MSKFEGTYPKTCVATGILSFPISSEADLVALKQWRTDRKIAKPKFPDKISGNILITKETYDKVRKYLEEVYLPFVNVLHADTDGEKGLDKATVAELLKQVKAEDWSNSNFPIRPLTQKDKDNRPSEDLIYKIKFSGPYEADFAKKALIKVDGVKTPVPLSTIDLPDSRKDINALWWGAGWTFQIGMRMNAFESATGTGVTAYVPTLYLIPELGLPIQGGGDADVIEDGDDWEAA